MIKQVTLSVLLSIFVYRVCQFPRFRLGGCSNRSSSASMVSDRCTDLEDVSAQHLKCALSVASFTEEVFKVLPGNIPG